MGDILDRQTCILLQIVAEKSKISSSKLSETALFGHRANMAKLSELSVYQHEEKMHSLVFHKFTSSLWLNFT